MKKLVRYGISTVRGPKTITCNTLYAIHSATKHSRQMPFLAVYKLNANVEH